MPFLCPLCAFARAHVSVSEMLIVFWDQVVLVPTHRTYMDFLVVSYVLFGLDLPVPHIAAAEDFLQLKALSEVLRRCGAFFMRRQYQVFAGPRRGTGACTKPECSPERTRRTSPF